MDRLVRFMSSQPWGLIACLYVFFVVVFMVLVAGMAEPYEEDEG